jgi:hypothetical protein
LGREKVVFVDFRRGRKPPPTGFGGGPRFLFGLFLSVLLLEVLGAAIVWPSSIGSAFFGPTAIAVAVALALGVDRLVARARFARLRGRGRGSDGHGEGSAGRTLH